MCVTHCKYFWTFEAEKITNWPSASRLPTIRRVILPRQPNRYSTQRFLLENQLFLTLKNILNFTLWSFIKLNTTCMRKTRTRPINMTLRSVTFSTRSRGYARKGITTGTAVVIVYNIINYNNNFNIIRAPPALYTS